MNMHPRLAILKPGVRSISGFILTLLTMTAGIPTVLNSQIWSDNFESYAVGGIPLATSARNAKIVDGTDTIGTGNAVVQTHESSTTGLQYNLSETAEGSVGVFYASFDVFNADPSQGESGRGIWIGTGLWSSVDGSALDMKSLSARHFSLRIMSGEDAENPGFAVMDVITNENLREFQTFDLYSLDEAQHVEFFVNDNDTNPVDYIRPDTDETDALAANSFAIFVNKTLLITSTLHPDLSAGDMTIGRFGTYTGSKDRGVFHVDNVTFDSAFPGPLSYSVDPTEVKLTAAGGAADVTVTVSRPDGEWVANDGDDWISYSDAITTGSGAITITATENTSYDSRSTSVTVAGVEVTVIQAGVEQSEGSISYSENFESYSVGDNPMATSARNAKVVDASDSIGSGQALRMTHESSTTGLQYNLTASENIGLQTLYASFDLFNSDPSVGEVNDGIWIGPGRWSSIDGSSLSMKSFNTRHFSIRVMSMEDPENPGMGKLDVITDSNLVDSQSFSSYKLDEALHFEIFVNDHDSDAATYYHPETWVMEELAANSFTIYINGEHLISASLHPIYAAGNTTLGRFGSFSGSKDRIDFIIDNMQLESSFPAPSVPSDLPWEADGVEVGDTVVSPWFGSFEVAENDWLNHSELGWISVGFVEETSNMWLWSMFWESWLWTSQANFPIVFDFENNRWIYYFMTPDSGVYVYDYSLGNWVKVD